MSAKKGRKAFAQNLLRVAGGPTLYTDDSKLSAGDSDRVKQAFLLWCGVIRDCVGVENNANEGRIVELLVSCYTTPIFYLLDGLGAMDALLLSSCEDRHLRSEAALKTVIQEHPRAKKPLTLIKGLLATHRRAWRDFSSIYAFSKCHQVYCFLSRLNLRDEDSLREVAYTKWCDSEQRVCTAGTPSDIEKKVCEEWFPIWNTALLCEWFSPSHSSGSTFEGVSNPAEKFLLLGADENLETFLKLIGWHDLLEVDDLMQSPFLKAGGQKLICSVPAVSRNGYHIPAHFVTFVPKNWKTFRVVSMEPITFMWLQHGAARALQTYLKSRQAPALSAMYCVDTEEQNRRAAQLGSKDGSIATIDLSSASDLVPLRYMRELCRDTGLYPFIEHLRTPYAVMPGKVTKTYRDESCYEVEKYAPMGSALCFPLESIFFSVVLFGVYRSAVLSNQYSKSELKRMRASLHVYGDDCTVAVELVTPFMQRLAEIGAVVNPDKSFFNAGPSHDFFRESCGGEFLNGEDITPARISRKFAGIEIDWSDPDDEDTAKQVARLVQLANDLYDLPTARWMVIDRLLSSGVPVIFDETGDLGIKSTSPTNFHLKRRWNVDLQREEVWAVRLCKVSKGFYRQYGKKCLSEDQRYIYTADLLDLPGEIRLFEYLRRASLSRRNQLLFPEEGLQLQLDPHSFDIVAHVTWVPTP